MTNYDQAIADYESALADFSKVESVSDEWYSKLKTLQEKLDLCNELARNIFLCGMFIEHQEICERLISVNNSYEKLFERSPVGFDRLVM